MSENFSHQPGTGVPLQRVVRWQIIMEADGIDAELLFELRRNALLRRDFLTFPRGLKIINRDIHHGVAALLAENSFDMRESCTRLKSNRHWDDGMTHNKR